MLTTEYVMLDALRHWDFFRDAVKYGAVPGSLDEAVKALDKAISDHCSEYDGEFIISDPEKSGNEISELAPWVNSLLFNALSDLVNGEDDMLKWASKCRAARLALDKARKIS